MCACISGSAQEKADAQEQKKAEAAELKAQKAEAALEAKRRRDEE